MTPNTYCALIIGFSVCSPYKSELKVETVAIILKLLPTFTARLTRVLNTSFEQ